MIRKATRTITFSLTLAALTAFVGPAFAQSTTQSPSSPPPTPGVVTGADPEPDFVQIIFAVLLLA